MSKSAELNLDLHDKQGIAFDTEATEVLYGGAAGGGKSHLMRVAAITWCASIPGLQVYLFRRIRDDLVKNHMEGPKGFRSVLAGWVMCGFVRIVDDEIRFWNGSKIYLCHCKDEKDIYKYQGAEIHVLLVDELTHFTETMYRFLRNRVRMVGVNLPSNYAGRFPRILAGANPGNVGHLWVKATFVDGANTYELRKMQASEGGMLRQFIPALLEDNPSMGLDDPGYEQRLHGLGSQALVEAMRYGNWDVVEGAFFDCWDPKRHVIRPFTIPDSWLRFMSGDWGSAAPFSFGWWAVASDPMQVENKDGGKITIPRGCMVRYREWYGASKPNVGLKLHAEPVAKGIKDRESKDTVKPTYRVLDPAAFAEDGGPSIAMAMASAKDETGKPLGISFRPADNARVQGRGAMGGWDQMRGRLVGDEDGNPMIVAFSTCHDSIRTIPALQHDDARPEDVDTDGEDHCFAAGTMVETREGPRAIETLVDTMGTVVTVGDQLASYRSVRMTKKNAELVRVTFADGRTVTCTPDHKFMVDVDEWRYASDLKGRSVLCSQPWLARASRNIRPFVTTSAADTSSAKAFGSIASSGRTLTDLCRKAGTFITSTTIGRTIVSPISNAFRWLRTWATGTAKKAATEAEQRWTSPALVLPSGTGQMMAANGIATTSSVPYDRYSSGGLMPFVRNAARPTKSAQPESSKASFAAPFAEPALCVGVERLSERADVYCLTVPETGCFAIEGGLIVSNCGDEWRYGCMSRPWVKKPKVDPRKPSDAYSRMTAPHAETWRA